MAPRKTASAGEDDQCPTLKLIMEKGPLSGQTNVFGPGTRIQIGRTVSGNTLSIKDAGISTKHLAIQVQPFTGGRRSWTVTDLKSSNHTFLNGDRLEPFEPAALSDGDVIIIGEQTSIKVRFEVNVGEIEGNSTRIMRRNARRGVRKQVEELGVIDEDSELGLGIQNQRSENNLRPGLINEKTVDLGNEDEKLGVAAVNEETGRGRRTRGSKARELENGSKEEIESIGKVSLRRTRRCKKNENSENLIINLDEKNDEMAEVEVKQGRNVGMRRTRSAKNNENLELSGVKGNERVSVRRTRSSRKEDNSTDDPLIDLSVIEGKRTRKCTRRRVEEGPVEVGNGAVVERVTCERENATALFASTCGVKEGPVEDGNGEVVERATCKRENATALFASTSGVKEGPVEDGNGEVVADLEKMTLGEWFEFLEVYLPKQIVDETEEIISEMRQKAERLHEFVLQHKNGTEKGNVAMDEKTD